MMFKTMLWLIAIGGAALAAPRRDAGSTVPVPGDPLELVTGPAHAVKSSGRRNVVVQLLDRARNNYALRRGGQGYDLKVSFTVDSGGQTEHDGSWKMEDIFDPKQGHRWTAEASDSYAIIRISSHGAFYGDEPASHVPLRLQEVRAALFDSIPPSENVARAAIRKSNVVVNGASLTCVLLSVARNVPSGTPGRRWDESEECFDPESGLLRTHSQVPGRYYSYDYTNAPRLADHVLPRKVIVTEAGRTVTTISVDSLTPLPAADPSLFVPTEEMKARGRAITMARAQKIWQASGAGASAPGQPAHVVCVFGVVTPAGELVEAHSLQPSDPNSQAAVEAARQMSYSYPGPLALRPQQHFVFVIQEFVSSP